MTGVSVLILTLNEEVNIAACIDSCAWSDDVVVFDSMSQDRTREIAAEKHARVFERDFDNYAAQRNAALSTVAYRHPWVLMVDADERVPIALATEIKAAVQQARGTTALFRTRRKDFLLGRWLKRSSGYPTWFGRLMRVGHAHFEQGFNEECVTSGSIEYLQEHLLHYPFNKGVAYWLERHNLYSTMEALAKERDQHAPWRPLMMFSSDPAVRRRQLKIFAHRMPLRPVLVFFYLYLLRLGFLDGQAGLYFSGLRAVYEYFIDLKRLEMTRRRQGETM